MQKVVQGQIVAIEPRANGWAAVHITEPGKQYPVKLSTKREDLLGAAQQMAWQMVDALYNEEQSTNINPHNGQPYVNRYLEQLAPAGHGSLPQQPQQMPTAVPSTGLAPQPQQGIGNLQPQMPPQPVVQNPPFPPQPQYQGMPLPPQGQQATIRHEVVDSDQRETRIMRQAATKVAASFLPMLAEEDRNLGSLIRISEQLLKYYREGVSWETAPPEMPPATHESVHAGNEPAVDPGREQGDPFPEGY